MSDRSRTRFGGATRRRGRGRLVAAVGACLVVAASCGSDTNDAGEVTDPPPSSATATTPTSGSPGTGDPVTSTTEESGGLPVETTLDVPNDFPTIQEAVDAAGSGDLILVAPGVYHEAVVVETPELTIRGVERETVILDGEFELDNGILVAEAPGVAIENMTARNYTVNGFFWTGVEGYRGSYLTAIRNGDYGVYAFDSTKGQLEHSYASGSPDAGFYIGQCYPCDAVIDDVVSEFNGLGYSGTNAGGNLVIANSVFRRNRAGVVPNSGSYELCYPQRENTIVGNLVYENNNGETPAIDVARLAQGNGILAAGGVGNRIERNRVWDHDRTGIALVPYAEDGATDEQPAQEDWDTPCSEQREQPIPENPPDSVIWNSWDNRVTGNVVSESGLADVGVAGVGDETSTLRNCFSDNDIESTAPSDLEELAPCDADASAPDTAWQRQPLDVVKWLEELASMPESMDYETAALPLPPPLENMPEARTAPARPATDVPFPIDTDAIEVPDEP